MTWIATVRSQGAVLNQCSFSIKTKVIEPNVYDELYENEKAEVYQGCKLSNFTIRDDQENIEFGEISYDHDDNIKQALGISDSLLESLHSSIFHSLPNLELLVIKNTKLPNFKRGFLENVNYLRKLIITTSSVQKIENFTFKTFSKLTHLFMNANQISSIEENAFDGLENLKILDLQLNSLVYLEKDTFYSLKNLEKLYLSNNHIKFLDFSLKNSRNLVKVFLYKNEICYIKRDFFEGLKLLDEVELMENSCINEGFIKLNGSLTNLNNELTNCYNNFNCVLNCETQQADDYFLIRKIYCELSNNNTKISENFTNIADTTFMDLKKNITETSANLGKEFKLLREFDSSLKTNLSNLLTKISDTESEINRLEQDLNSFSKVAQSAEAEVKNLDAKNSNSSKLFQESVEKNLTESKHEIIQKSSETIEMLMIAIGVEFLMVMILFGLVIYLIFRQRGKTVEYTELTPRTQ